MYYLYIFYRKYLIQMHLLYLNELDELLNNYLLFHADFFIGLGSGLSWLAHSVGCPVILISGMSEPWYEFPTQYRAINYLACHGCFQDLSHNFLHRLCPHHAGTERELECSKRITPQQVIGMIQRCRLDLAE